MGLIFLAPCPPALVAPPPDCLPTTRADPLTRGFSDLGWAIEARELLQANSETVLHVSGRRFLDLRVVFDLHPSPVNAALRDQS